MMSCGKWAPLKLMAIVTLPHDARLVMGGDHIANGLKCKFATEPWRTLFELKPFNPMLGVAQSLQLKHGKFMEQISEVEAFFGLYAVNPFFHPVDVKGSDG